MRVFKIIGKKWSVKILKVLEKLEVATFTQLKNNVKNISNRVLSERLREFEELNFIERRIKLDRSVEYKLSSRGSSLIKFLEKIKSLSQA